MHPWTRVDRWGTGGDASRRYLYTPVSITQDDNECRLEGDKTHVPLFKQKNGGDISYVVPTKLKSGGGASPTVPHRSAPVASVNADSGLMYAAATFTDALPPIPSRCRLLGTSFRTFREITQHHFNVDRMAAILSRN